ncbi:MAG: serine/threonine protein kinase, partial [bacterium]|nr:serine/threonine protein kinase [bacterium]
MNGPELQRLEELFHVAADLAEGERDAFLDRECEEAPELRRRLEAMLAQVDRDETLEAPAAVSLTEGPQTIEGPGTVIDRYKLLQVIGEGGFGVVYMAEQLES